MEPYQQESRGHKEKKGKRGVSVAGNTFGTLFRISTFGESHGAALGVIIDGCPAGLALDADVIQKDLDRRRPGAHAENSDGTERDARLNPAVTTLAHAAVISGGYRV